MRFGVFTAQDYAEFFDRALLSETHRRPTVIGRRAGRISGTYQPGEPGWFLRYSVYLQRDGSTVVGVTDALYTRLPPGDKALVALLGPPDGFGQEDIVPL